MFWYVGMLVENMRGRIQLLRDDERRELGASALEWAIIAAIAVVIATVIGAVIYNVVKQKGKDLQSCANQPVNTSCTP